MAKKTPNQNLICDQLQPHRLRVVGKQNNHLRVELHHSKGTLQAIGFNLANFAKYADRKWTVIFTPEYNVFNGKKSIQARLHAIHAK